jgi:hypothetical protein
MNEQPNNNSSDNNPADQKAGDLKPGDLKPGEFSPKLLHAFDLIFALCVDQITDTEARELETLVSNDPEICDFYIDIMHLKSSLRRYSFYFAPPMKMKLTGQDLAQEQARIEGRLTSLNESMVLPAISDLDEQDEDLTERFQPAPVTSEGSPAPERRSLPTIVKGGIAALFILTIGLLGYVAMSRRGLERGKSLHAGPVAVATQPTLLPAPEPIATMNFTQKPVWQAAPPLDGRFFAHQLLILQSGDVQLSLHAGGRLVIEGPAEVEFVSQNKIALRRGKIAATVPGGGLVVDCPHGSVTDLGTQFGVNVQPDGATEIAVFKGRVSASLNSDSSDSRATTQASRQLLLTAGQAAAMSPTALKVDEKGAMPQQFVRSLVNSDISSLDITDLICGGDGTTRRRGVGIDPSNGDVGNLRPVAAIIGDGKYHLANGSPFIDGAFITDAAKGAMIVDSAGDRFHFTGLGSTSYNCIFTGGKIPWPEKPAPDTILNGIDYAAPDHSIICIHPNNAITLDLNAARRMYPDLAIKRFHCRVGISGTAKPKDPKIPDAAVLVLTDGTPRFQNPHFTIFDGSFDVNIPLKETDRFMTLVSTYAGPGNYRNWVLWVDAKLDLSDGQ